MQVASIVALLLTAVPLFAEEPIPLERLVAQLSASDLAQRRDAIYRISKLGPGAKDALPAVLKALEDPDKQIWSLAVSIVASLGPQAADAVPVLAAGLDPKQKTGPRYRRGSEVPFRSAYALSRIGEAAIPALIEALKNPDPAVRAAAARGLGGIGPKAKSAIPPLVENLRHDQPLERRETAEALGAIGGEAVAPLTEALGSPEPALRAGAALALAQLGAAAKPAAARIVELAATETDPTARGALFSTLPKIGVDPARGAELLIAGVKDDNPAVRHDATNAIYLYRAAQPQIVAALTKLLRDSNPAISERAAAVIGRLGPTGAPAVDTLLAVARQRNPSPPIYFETLGQIGADAMPGILRAVEKENPDAITGDHWSVRAVPIIGGEALPALTRALTHSEIPVRLLAARGLGALGAVSASAFEPLKAATGDADPRVRAAALTALVGTHAQGVVALSKVEAGLKDASPVVRIAAAGLVGSFGERARSLAPTLLAGLDDADPKVRAAIIDALSSVGGAAEPAIPRLLEVAAKADAPTRVKIFDVFAGIGPNARAALPEARKQLTDADSAVRAAAVRAIGKIDDPNARVPVMLAALDDHDPLVRRAAAGEIGLLGDKARDATSKLTALLQHEDERDFAFDALRKINVKSVPDLVTMLSDRDLIVKGFAAQRLGRLGPAAKDAIPALEGILKSKEREEFKRRAADALKRIQP